MTMSKGVIISLVLTVIVVLCIVLICVRIVRAGVFRLPVEGRNKKLASGLALTVLIMFGVFGFVKMYTFRLPSDADAILIRSGTTGESFEISSGMSSDVFSELISVKLKIHAFSPLTAFRMGHDYTLTYYKNGEAVTELIMKGDVCQTYRFPFLYNTSVDITSMIDRYIENADKTTP